ncbi:MAG: response regulator [bacterium]
MNKQKLKTDKEKDIAYYRFIIKSEFTKVYDKDHGMSKAKIMIVEDEALISADLSLNLENIGYGVSSIVTTGKAAVEKAEEDRPDIILMDMQLEGEMDGIDAAEIIKTRFNIPIIFLTAFIDDERVRRAKKILPFGYILKPFKEHELEVTIEIALYAAQSDAQRRQVEKENEKLKKQIEFILGATKTGLDIIDENFIIRYIDPKWQEIYGDPAQKKCYEYFMDRSAPCPGCGIVKALETKTVTVTEQILVKENNRPIQVTCIPFQDENKEWLFAEVNVDISERKRAAEELQKNEIKFRNLFNINNDLMFVTVVGDKGPERIVEVNDAALRLLGYSREELINRAPSELIEPLDKAQCIRIVNDLHKTGWVTFEMVAITKEGRRIPIEMSSRLFKSDDQLYEIGAGRDITKRKKNEIALKAALDKAQESDRLKSEFLANMSHEIRTPLNPIIGYTDLMLADELSEAHRDYLKAMKKSGNLLISIIDGLLDLSKIEAGQFEIDQKSFSLKAIFNTITSASQMVISKRRKNITLRESVPDTISRSIIGDPTRVQQVMDNLMNNAIKFTESGFIEYGVSLRDTNRLEFYVRDTGIGIPQDKQSVIFNAFQQADGSYTRKYGGSGLGLTISKKLVELMGGEIKLTSKTGAEHGSTFYFTLPYKPTKIQNSEGTAYSGVLESKIDYTVLVAEDDFLNQSLARKILERAGYHVITTNDGKDAISLYKTDSSIDLILMDVQMPVLDGMEATKVIRTIETEEKRNHRIPIIGLTAYAMKGDRDKCINAGMDDYIAKPVRARELLLSIEKIIGKMSH